MYDCARADIPETSVRLATALRSYPWRDIFMPLPNLPAVKIVSADWNEAPSRGSIFPSKGTYKKASVRFFPGVEFIASAISGWVRGRL